MSRWARRAAGWLVVALVVWAVLTYYYLGPWLPGVIALALAIGALVGLTRDAAPAYAADLWPIDESDDEDQATEGFTDPRTRRLRQLCARAGEHDDEQLRRVLTQLAAGEPLPDRLDRTTLERLVRRLEER